MPIPIPPTPHAPLFPHLTRAQIDAARTSSWLPIFEDLSTPAVVIDLETIGERQAFEDWLDADSIFLPQDSEGSRIPSVPAAENNDQDTEAPVYRLPRLNEAIRSALETFGGAVFPKLNWTSPRDAAFIIPQTAHGPLHSTSPADIYLLLKSSDFVSHDTDPSRAYSVVAEDGSWDSEAEGSGQMKIELVLKRFIEMNPAREFRCFVRNRVLIGISQRDINFYDHLQLPETQRTICDTVRALFEDEIRENYEGGDDYVFDVYLTESFTSAIIVDFGVYRPSTDSLLFTYPELQSIANTSSSRLSSPSPASPSVPSSAPTSSTTALTNSHDAPGTLSRLPVFKTIDSPSHPAATRNAPTFGENMVPLEMIEMSEGRTMDEFRRAWEEAMAAGMNEDDDEEGEE